MVRLRVAYVVYRATFDLRVDGNVSQYELVFRIYGPMSSVSIRRLESSTITGFLPFDPVTVELEDVQIDTIPGEYVAKMTFVKRSANGSIVAHVPVVWRLSPTLGVSGEVAETHILLVDHVFESAVRDALASPVVAWSVDVEHARFDTLVSGAITLEGFVTDRLSSFPVRIHAEFLPDGTVTGIWIGEASRSPVTGTWTPDSFNLLTVFQRSAAHTSREFQFDGFQSSEYEFIDDNADSVQVEASSDEFTLQITSVGQGSSPAIQPQDFYLEARLAVLSVFPQGSAPHGLPIALWRQVFSFYDVSWFVQVKPRNKNVYHHEAPRPVGVRALIDDSTG